MLCCKINCAGTESTGMACVSTRHGRHYTSHESSKRGNVFGIIATRERPMKGGSAWSRSGCNESSKAFFNDQWKAAEITSQFDGGHWHFSNTSAINGLSSNVRRLIDSSYLAIAARVKRRLSTNVCWWVNNGYLTIAAHVTRAAIRQLVHVTTVT